MKPRLGQLNANDCHVGRNPQSSSGVLREPVRDRFVLGHAKHGSRRFLWLAVLLRLVLEIPAYSQVPAGNLGLFSLGLTSNAFGLRAIGPAGVGFEIDSSSNLLDWEQVLSITSFGGSYDFTDTNLTGLKTRFYRALLFLPPATNHYLGNSLVLMNHVPAGFGPGAVVQFDVNGDGMFEQQVTADASGLYTIALDTSALLGEANVSLFIRSADGSLTSPVTSLPIQRDSTGNPACVVPVNQVADAVSTIEPNICACVEDCEVCKDPGSLLFFGGSATPTDHGTELATGKLRSGFPVAGFGTQMLGFRFSLTHASLVAYDGPVGCGFSHSYNMMVVQSGENTGQIITPDLRIYDIASEDGVNWALPEGFYSQLTLNTNQHRWTLTHFSGLAVDFYQGSPGYPGYPVAVSEPNGNTTSLAYDGSGFLRTITTDLGQIQTLGYDGNGRLTSLTDHLGRAWSFAHDSSNRLTQITGPPTQYAAIPPGAEVTDVNAADALVTQGRTTTISFNDPQYPWSITSITDDRGAVPMAWAYDAQGRVSTNFINGMPQVYIYGPTANPAPPAALEPSNLRARVRDREGNLVDFEIHSRAGGPLAGAGPFGLRRKVTWTETGKGNPALRAGEPNYYEERWLQDCDCLRPKTVVQPFSSNDALQYDANGIPTNWPRTIFSYNANRQVTTNLHTDGVSSIETTSTYQPSGFGVSNQFSRKLTQTDPRAYDTNVIYAGLSFIHSYGYDTKGNLIDHTAPTVTRGVGAPEAIRESWTYNVHGQVLSHIDPNGNVTTFSYYTGPSAGGDINAKGGFGGYLASVTRGAAGSTDPPTSLTSLKKVNSLGMVIETIDPRGLTSDYEFNDLGELVRETEPSVTLRTGGQVRYTTSTLHDGAGNSVLISRTNIDFDGSVLPNASVDRSRTYDAVNNLLSERLEVDANHSDDLITHYAYNANDLRIITQKPQGNREFLIYDERLLPFKDFYGVAAGVQINSGYPTSKQATDLGTTSWVGYRQQNYDSRGNCVQMRDGRGYFSFYFYDFRNRQIAQSDPNGNGGAIAYDAAGNRLTTQAGAVSQVTGSIAQVLSRTYQRYDEAGRNYQTVLDIDPTSDESALANPAGPGNPSLVTIFDAGSRVTVSRDANGNPSTSTYDAANRRLAVTDALGNSAQNTYDSDGNVVALKETEVPGPGAIGAAESYATTFVYDEVNRQTEVHILGLNGNSIDHHTFSAYDSRRNVRLVQDSDDNFTLNTLDDQNRSTRFQRYDADPTGASAQELSRTEQVYDKNSRKIEDHAYSSVTNLASIQITQYAWDDGDRPIRTVFPDSDDPIDGSGNGPDGIYNRIETTYDANSSPIQVKEQREVIFNNAFDPGNRLSSQNITRTNDVPGISRQQFSYDARNLATSAMNDYARVDRSFDALGRLVNETQTIRLDGSGFTNGWEQPVSLLYGYDLQSNKTNSLVVAGTNTDLSISRKIDALNRNQTVYAQYFNIANSPVATYNYFGPERIQAKILGNDARVTNTFDVKRRLSSLAWMTPTNRLLAGFQYAYDPMDNPQYERWLHDNGYYDYYQYNHRYELSGVTYRSTNSAPPGGVETTFNYDDNRNRIDADFGGPFAAQPNTVDSYAINPADEYTRLTRNGIDTDPGCDRAGNMTSLPVLPVTGFAGQRDVSANVSWDAVNCLFDVDTGLTPVQHYRYDPFRRRVATLEGLGTTPVRRFIYDGWITVEERLFNAGATPASAPSTLERIYVDGQIDEHLLTAIDRNGDGMLGTVNLNQMDIDADQWYYFLPDRLGSVAALLAANNPNQTLEYYRYTAYGEATVLPVVDNNNDGLEDTPLDLSDNFAAGAQRSSAEHGNPYFFTGQRFDDQSGLFYYRNRFYEARAGRFISRDLERGLGDANPYPYGANEPGKYSDPLGLFFYSGALMNKYFPAGFNFNFTGSCEECGNNADTTTLTFGIKAVEVAEIGVKVDIVGNVDHHLEGPCTNKCGAVGSNCVFIVYITLQISANVVVDMGMGPMTFAHRYTCPCGSYSPGKTFPCGTESGVRPGSEGDWALWGQRRRARSRLRHHHRHHRHPSNLESWTESPLGIGSENHGVCGESAESQFNATAPILERVAPGPVRRPLAGRIRHYRFSR